MIMRDAIAKLMPLVKDEFVVCANGFISRDTFNVNDRPRNFYMLGSMGQASSIGLGFAMARPDEKVIVFDGDGNLLMNLGILTMISQIKPRNLTHVVFDNECYDSTGGQPTVSSAIALEGVAKGCGISKVYRAGPEDDIGGVFGGCLKEDGPVFLLIKVGRDPAEKMPRVNITPQDIAKRFKGA
jgi:thiamine pyrophosphate-dependent acetolactate synthase large subunit-like protein